MRIFTCGSMSRICAVASMPDRRGIRTSIKTTSGIRSCAFSTASWPSLASPTSSRSSSLPRTISRPRRNSAWSSTTITRSRSLSPVLVTRAPSASILVGLDRRDVRVSYGTLRVGRLLLPVVVAQLTFELVAHPIDRRREVAGLGRCTERLARYTQGALDALDAVDGRVVLVDQLDVEGGGARLDAAQRPQLVLCHGSETVADVHAPAGEGHVHAGPVLPQPVCRWAHVRLTWSFAPHSPAGALARPPGRPRHPHSRPLPETGAGLTSKPRHAQPPTVALRGSLRPRLASTTGEHPRATTDPNVSPPEDRQTWDHRATAASRVIAQPPGRAPLVRRWLAERRQPRRPSHRSSRRRQPAARVAVACRQRRRHPASRSAGPRPNASPAGLSRRGDATAGRPGRRARARAP